MDFLHHARASGERGHGGIYGKEVLDYSAVFDVALQGGTYYKYDLYEGAIEAIDPWFASVISQGPAHTDPTATLSNLLPETTYTLVGIAFDDQDVYGDASWITFTTQSPLPGRDSEEYRRMLGTWNMLYDNLIGDEHPVLTVTIAEEAVGNTYLVSGLLSQASRDATGIDDTVRARFIDNEIVLESGTPVANSGSLSGEYEVKLFLTTAAFQYIPSNVQLRGSYDSTGSIRFSGTPAEVVGYIIAYRDDSGALPIEHLSPTNIKLVKLGAGQTEGFQYDTPWNPGWE